MMEESSEITRSRDKIRKARTYHTVVERRGGGRADYVTPGLSFD